jgi:hypothetical protein
MVELPKPAGGNIGRSTFYAHYLLRGSFEAL